jgi:hypothetical protein
MIWIFSKPNEGRFSEGLAALGWILIWILSKPNEGRFSEGLAALGWINNFDFF